MKLENLANGNSHQTLHDRREINKMSLNTFSFDFESKLEQEADDTIRRIENQNHKSIENAKDLERIRSTDPKQWEELQERASQSDINLDHQIHEQYYDSFLWSGVQYAFSEVKVVYLFHQLEIAVNRLLKACYPEEIKKNLHRFEDLSTFCQGKNIAVKELEGFTEVDQLKRVSNALKHSGEIEDRIKNIAEFNGKQEIHFNDLENFYKRVKDFPKIFLAKLGGRIYGDLYEFTDNRIAALAESYVLRMDKDTATKFCKLLSQHYL
jgi:hypothetical protein